LKSGRKVKFYIAKYIIQKRTRNQKK